LSNHEPLTIIEITKDHEDSCETSPKLVAPPEDEIPKGDDNVISVDAMIEDGRIEPAKDIGVQKSCELNGQAD